MNHAYSRVRRRTPSGGISMTEQSHAKSCDINRIMAKYIKTGLVDHVSRHEGTYGDVSSCDFQEAQNLIAGQISVFNELPAAVRKKFDNDPYNYLAMVETDEGVERLKALLKPETGDEDQDDWVRRLEALEAKAKAPKEPDGDSKAVT